MISSDKLHLEKITMISPWLIDALYEIAQLLCVYTPSKKRPTTLLQLYTCIESGRKEHNKCSDITERYEEEWDITHSGAGYSLFFSDAQTKQIFMKASDSDDQLHINIGNKKHDIFYAVVLGNGMVYRHILHERMLSNDTHIALLQLLNSDILSGWLFEENEKIQKLPSYSLH